MDYELEKQSFSILEDSENLGDKVILRIGETKDKINVKDLLAVKERANTNMQTLRDTITKSEENIKVMIEKNADLQKYQEMTQDEIIEIGTLINSILYIKNVEGQIAELEDAVRENNAMFEKIATDTGLTLGDPIVSPYVAE